MKHNLEILVAIVFSCVLTSHSAPTRHEYESMLMVSAESLPSKSNVNQHQVDDSETIQLLLAALDATQGSTDKIKYPITLPTHRLGKGQANEQMKALVQAIGEEIMADTQGSQEKLERALQQLFDMPSFPIIRLYPNDG